MGRPLLTRPLQSAKRSLRNSTKRRRTFLAPSPLSSLQSPSCRSTTPCYKCLPATSLVLLPLCRMLCKDTLHCWRVCSHTLRGRLCPLSSRLLRTTLTPSQPSSNRTHPSQVQSSAFFRR